MLQSTILRRVGRTGTVVKQTLLGNSLFTWLVALGVSVGLVLLLAAVRRLLMKRLMRTAERTGAGADSLGLLLLRHTRFLFLLFVSLTAASFLLTLPDGTRHVVTAVSVLALLLQMAEWGNALITFTLARYAARRADSSDGAVTNTTVTALSYLGRGVLWVIILTLALDSVGVNVSRLVAGLGIGGIAIAFALQNVLADIFAAVSIVLDKPFVVGDPIQVDTFIGNVEHIGVKTTRIRSENGEQIIFSNAELLKSRIRNYGRMTERRALLLLRVAADTPAERAARVPVLLQEIVQSVKGTRFIRSHLKAVSDAWLDYETAYFLPDPSFLTFMDVQQTVALGVLERFAAEGIELAAHLEADVKRQMAGERSEHGSRLGS